MSQGGRFVARLLAVSCPLTVPIMSQEGRLVARLLPGSESQETKSVWMAKEVSILLKPPLILPASTHQGAAASHRSAGAGQGLQSYLACSMPAKHWASSWLWLW